MNERPDIEPGELRRRALRPGDADALASLEAICAAADDGPARSEGELRRILDAGADVLEADTICLADDADRPLAYGRVVIDETLPHERRAFLEERVHPDLRGSRAEEEIVRWMEERAAARLGVVDDDRRDDRPALLRFDVTYRSEERPELYRQHGYTFALAEEEMRRDLTTGLPENALPSGIVAAAWSDTTAPLFHAAYHDAFRERPGFPDWSEETWRRAITGGEGFRPDLSRVLLEGNEPAGFAVVWIEAGDQRPIGWIVQMGVRPAWRRRGLGATILATTLRNLREAGIAEAALDVNVNNPGAIALYHSLGFTLTRRFTSYRKSLPLS